MASSSLGAVRNALLLQAAVTGLLAVQAPSGSWTVASVVLAAGAVFVGTGVQASPTWRTAVLGFESVAVAFGAVGLLSGHYVPGTLIGLGLLVRLLTGTFAQAFDEQPRVSYPSAIPSGAPPSAAEHPVFAAAAPSPTPTPAPAPMPMPVPVPGWGAPVAQAWGTPLAAAVQPPFPAAVPPPFPAAVPPPVPAAVQPPPVPAAVPPPFPAAVPPPPVPAAVPPPPVPAPVAQAPLPLAPPAPAALAPPAPLPVVPAVVPVEVPEALVPAQPRSAPAAMTVLPRR